MAEDREIIDKLERRVHQLEDLLVWQDFMYDAGETWLFLRDMAMEGRE